MNTNTLTLSRTSIASTEYINTKYTILFSWIFLTIPLIALSYGSDPDAARLADAGWKTWTTGEYVKSRSSGFPIYELLIGPLAYYGQWFYTNLLSLFFGFITILALIKLAERNSFNHSNLVILTMAFSPVFIKNATSTMDYMGGIAMLTWSYFFMVQGRFVLCAIFIGLAVGFRPIYGLSLIPFFIYLFYLRQPLTNLAKYSVVSIATGTICYSPHLITYGIPESAYLPIENIKDHILAGGYKFLAFLGVLPSFAVYISLTLALYNIRKKITALA